MKEFDLLPLLDYIDPSTLDYTEWVQVGMALKHEGYDETDWDAWSQRDGARYHDGECEMIRSRQRNALTRQLIRTTNLSTPPI